MDLISANIQVKIADLGFAKIMEYEDMSQTMCGTPLVMAPEVLNGKFYNHKADVWSLGIVFFELLTGFTPFNGYNKDDLQKNLNTGNYQLPKTLKISLDGLDFLNKCLQFESEDRLSWSELIVHPYLDDKQEGEGIYLSYFQDSGTFQSTNPFKKVGINLNIKNP